MRRADEEEDDKEEKSKSPDPQSSEIAKALYKSRTVLVFGEVDMKMAERVTAQLLAYAESEGDIRVIVNSPGGHVESGDTIHDMIRFVGNRVKVIGTGWVASAGAHIYLGASPCRSPSRGCRQSGSCRGSCPRIPHGRRASSR